MAVAKKYGGQCLVCCPGHDCDHEYWGQDDQGRTLKRCTNCFTVTVVRQAKKRTTPSRFQARVASTLQELGWTVVQEMLANGKLSLRFDDPSRPWYDGNSGYGFVGPRGAIDIKLFVMSGFDKTITDMDGIYTWMRKNK